MTYGMTLYEAGKKTSSTVRCESGFAATCAGMSIRGGDGEVLEDVSKGGGLRREQTQSRRLCQSQKGLRSESVPYQMLFRLPEQIRLLEQILRRRRRHWSRGQQGAARVRVPHHVARRVGVTHRSGGGGGRRNSSRVGAAGAAHAARAALEVASCGSRRRNFPRELPSRQQHGCGVSRSAGCGCCHLRRLRRPGRVEQVRSTENLLYREPHLLHALDLLLYDLLDVRVEVDGEREEDLEVGHAQVPLVVRQEREQLLLVPVQVDERLEILLRRNGPPDPLIDRLQRDGAVLLGVVGVDAVLAVAKVDDPAELVRPLLGDVDPRGQVVPIELDLRFVSMPSQEVSRFLKIPTRNRF